MLEVNTAFKKCTVEACVLKQTDRQQLAPGSQTPTTLIITGSLPVLISKVSLLYLETSGDTQMKQFVEHMKLGL